MLTSSSLALEVEASLRRAIDDGLVGADLRKIVIGPSDDRHRIDIWAVAGWSDYDDRPPAAPLASVDNRAALEVIDALEAKAKKTSGTKAKVLFDRYESALRPSRLAHPDPRVDAAIVAHEERLEATIVAALREVATGGRLPQLTAKVVGLFSFNVGKRSSMRLEAFYHPHGAGRLLSVMEKIPPTTLVYPWASLHDDGITLFFKGDDDTASEVKERLFANMSFYAFDDGEAHVRMKTEAMTYAYQHGHENQSLSNDEVDALLAVHLKKRPELALDLEGFPAPNDKKAVDRFVALYRESGFEHETRKVVASIVKRHGPLAPAVLLDELPQSHPGRTQGYGVWSELLAKAERYEEALAAARQIDASWRYYYWEAELESLVELGRFDELERFCAERAKDQGRGHSGPPLERTAPYRALALVKQGRSGEAMALLERHKDDRGEHEHAWAKAAALAATNPAAAESALRAALGAGSSFVHRATRDFAAYPRLMALLEERARHERAREQSAVAAERRVRRVIAKTLPKPRAAQGSWHVAGRQAKRPTKRKSKSTLRGPSMQALQRVLLTDDHVDSWHHAKGFSVAMTSSGLCVVDTSRPKRPVLLASFAASTERHTAALLDGHELIVAATDRIAWFDLAKPSAPKLRSVLAVGIEDDDRVYIDRLERRGDLVFAFRSGLIIVRSPRGGRPSVVGRLPINPVQLALSGTRLMVADGAKDLLWEVKVPKAGAAQVVGVHPVKTSKGDKVVLDDATAFAWQGKRLVLTRPGGTVLCRHVAPKARPDGLDARGKKLVRPIVELVARALAELRQSKPDFLAGVLKLGWGGGPSLTLTVDAPRGFVGLESGYALEEPLAVELAFADVIADVQLEGLLSWGPQVDALRRKADEDQDRLRAMNTRRHEVWHATLRDVARALTRRSEVEAVASGRVYLLIEAAGLELASIMHTRKPWVPHRPLPTGEVPIEKLIEDYQQTSTIYRRARKDAAVRTEVFRLSAQGRWMAIKIALALADIDIEGVMGCLSQAVATTDAEGFATIPVMKFLASHRERPDARRILETVLAEGREHWVVHAAAALQRNDVLTREATRMLDALFEDGSQLWGSQLETFDACFEALRDGLEPLRPRLVAAMANLKPSHDDALAALAMALYRSGHAQAPELVREKAQVAKQDEEYHGASGIAELDEESNFAPEKIATAEREWTSDALVTRVATLAKSNALDESVWPSDLPPEPYPASWRYFFALAWPKIERAGQVDWLVATLARHTDLEPKWRNDKKLLLAVYDELARRNDAVRAAALAKAVMDSPTGAFDGVATRSDASIRASMEKLHGQASAVQGFALARAGKLDEARALCDALLATAPADGQALFLDARLAWLASTPEAGIERAKQNLDRTSDAPGRGRLFNLMGCAFDELKRWPEAIEAFKQAHSIHTDAEYLANIAECYQKLGDVESARSHAVAAKRAGSKAPIVATILAE